ncbi:MAG: family 43 glycosylhydrolase [bacterium]|nr:family 43 glycosylhydrolase [bacterium]
MVNKEKGLLYTAIILLAFVLLGSASQMNAQKGASYANPVQAGDYPDPSVIRVGKDYYATATSSEWGPEFPILHSRDLVNWNIVGVVFPKRPEWSVGNYWAPEIWQENGRFYVFYVARRKDGPLCIAAASASKPMGPYTDHGALECQEVGSIDAFPIRDENGRLFIVWKEDGNSVNKPTPLWAQELDLANWKLIGPRKEILRNDPDTWEGNLIEGPYIIRKNGYFYMFYSGNACCGRGCNYAMGTARSKTLLGTWEKDPANPILKGNDAANCPGHGTIVTTEDGRAYMMYHAFDRKDFNTVGRQAYLDEVNWTKDGWAKINNGMGASKAAAAPHGIAEKEEEYRFFDDFNAPTLRFGWQWLQNSIPAYSISGGFLKLTPNAEQMANPIGGIMAYYTTNGSYTATTQIDRKSLTSGAIAGLSAYGDGENALGFGLQDDKIVVWRRERNNHRRLSTHDAPVGGLIYLRMTARDGTFYSFATSVEGRKFTPVGSEQNGDYLPPWDRGVRVAMTVGGVENATARFGFLRIEPAK